MDADLYELLRTGWQTPYPDTAVAGAAPLRMASPGTYPDEKLASFGPGITPSPGSATPPPLPVTTPPTTVCTVGGADQAAGGAPTCALTSPLPPDCDNPFRCYILFESQLDECDPEWFGCPRTLGVFCLNVANPAMLVNSWFIMDDPSWLTGGTDPVAWYLIEMPHLPGVTRACSPVTTNAAPGDALPGAPVGNYVPCSLQDLVDLRQLCQNADANGVVVWQGAEIKLPPKFCETVTDTINKVENPGKYLGTPVDPVGGGPLHTPSRVGICIGRWTITWDPCLATHLPNGDKCPYPGGWGPPKLEALQCMSTLVWAVLKATLSPGGEYGPIAGHPDDPVSDCIRQFYIAYRHCTTIGEACRLNSHIRPLTPSTPGGNDTCVCPGPNGTWYRCPCGSPDSVPGGWDPCDPANGYVPQAQNHNCDGGGIPIDTPGGASGGVGVPNTPGGGISHTQPANPVVVPRDWGRTPLKPADACAQFACEYQCTTCKGAMLVGADNPAAPQGGWSALMSYHACEPNLCGWEKQRRQDCTVSGPCTRQFKEATRTKGCASTVPVGQPPNTKLYCVDPAPMFPGTDNPDFYNTCPVCKGYKEGTWVCRGNPQVLTRGSWSATFDCKTLAEWKKFFEEVRCNQWRSLIWSSCLGGACSSHECGVTWKDQEGVNRSGDCPPQDLRGVPRSGDDPSTTTIGYTAKYTPCGTEFGSVIATVSEVHPPVYETWGIVSGPSCEASGLSTNPGTCDPVTGKSLNCAAGTTYSTRHFSIFATHCTPLKSVAPPPATRNKPSASGCHPTYGYSTLTVRSGPCLYSYTWSWYSSSPGGDGWCYSGQGGTYAEDSSRCERLSAAVVCADGRKLGCNSGSLCNNSLEPLRFHCQTINYTRNDCKTPPTAT